MAIGRTHHTIIADARASDKHQPILSNISITSDGPDSSIMVPEGFSSYTGAIGRSYRSYIEGEKR